MTPVPEFPVLLTLCVIPWMAGAVTLLAWGAWCALRATAARVREGRP